MNLLPLYDAQLWNQFVQDMCTVLIDTFGIDVVDKWRWRVGSEIETPGMHWLGTVQDYLEHYKNTVSAVHAVLPNVKVGAHFRDPGFTNATVLYSGETVRSFGVDWMQMCKNDTVPYDFMAVSWYPRLDGDQDPHDFYEDDIAPFREHADFNSNATFGIHEYKLISQIKNGIFVQCVTSHHAAFFAKVAGLVYEKGIEKVHAWRDKGQGIEYPRLKCVEILETMEDKQGYVSTSLGTPAISTNEIAALVAKTDSSYEMMVSNYNQTNHDYQTAEDITLLMETTLPAGTVYVRNAYITSENSAINVFLENEPAEG